MDKNIYLSNLQPDPQDVRDWLFEAEPDMILPDEVDLRKASPKRRENQLNIGSCTGATMVNGGERFLSSAGLFNDTEVVDDKDLSILFNYATSRKLLFPGVDLTDGGSTARMALKAAKNFGIAREAVYRYDVLKVNEEPTEAAYKDAENFRVGAYSRISLSGGNDDVVYQIKYALAKGWPVAVGLRVGRALRTQPKDEPYSFVNPSVNPYWGNHEMLIVGYCYDKYGILCWIIENSWGDEWADGGFFLCRAYVAVVDVIDLWVIQGFAGVERIGVDQTRRKPAPEPTPEPVPVPVPPTPIPEPLPEPPKPVPPEPTPPLKDKENTGKIFGIFLFMATLIRKVGKRFERKQ